MRDGPFKAGNAHRVVPAETSEKCRDGSQQTKLRSSSERGPACGQGSLGRFSEGGIWAGAAVRGTDAKFHPLTSALRGFLSGGFSSEREFGL